jgi:hypothetical protein
MYHTTTMMEFGNYYMISSVESKMIESSILHTLSLAYCSPVTSNWPFHSRAVFVELV